MTREEQRAYTWAAVKSALLITLVFGGVFAAFIAFCQFIWFMVRNIWIDKHKSWNKVHYVV